MAADKTDRRAAIMTVIACIAFAITARSFNANIGYANGFNCDSWYFLGIQLDFDDFYRLGAYQTLRFPAIVPWIYLGRVVEYEALNFIKFISYFTLTCSAFMWFTFRLFGIRIAILTTVLFCCSTSFLGVLSHDYLTAAGLTWISLFVASTVEASRSRHLLFWSVITGILFGMCLYTHLPTGLFIFAVPLLFAAVFPAGSRLERRGLIFLAGGLVGFVTITVVLGLYNMSLGGSFYYIGPQLDLALSLLNVRTNTTTGRIAGLSWLGTEGIVPVLIVMIAGSTVLLAQERGRVVGNPVGAAGLVCLITSMFVFGWELSGRVLLQHNVYGAWIYPVLFAGLAAMLSRISGVRAISRTLFVRLVTLILVLSMGAALTTRSVGSDQLLLVVKILSGVGFLLAFVLFAKSARSVLILVPLTALVLLSFPTSYGSIPWYSEVGMPKEMTVQAANAVRRYRSLNVRELPVFWVGARIPEVIAVPRSFMNCGIFAGSFPKTGKGDQGWEVFFPPLTADLIGSAKTLVVVASGDNLGATATTALKELGFDSQVLGEWPIGPGQLNTSMAVLRLDRR